MTYSSLNMAKLSTLTGIMELVGAIRYYHISIASELEFLESGTSAVVIFTRPQNVPSVNYSDARLQECQSRMLDSQISLGYQTFECTPASCGKQIKARPGRHKGIRSDLCDAPFIRCHLCLGSWRGAVLLLNKNSEDQAGVRRESDDRAVSSHLLSQSRRQKPGLLPRPQVSSP